MLPIEQDLVRTIRAGISGTAMPAFSQLRDDELTSLIAYLRQLSHSWRDPTLVAAPLPLPDPPIWFTSPTEARGHRQHGGELFAALCVPCHGPAGKGDGPVSLNLFDAWGRPIRPADLTAAHHKSGDSPRDLYRSIATGLNGTPMPGFAPTLGVEEIWDLVSFLTSGR
jgi:mono/diheme cytochrome c family protein